MTILSYYQFDSSAFYFFPFDTQPRLTSVRQTKPYNSLFRDLQVCQRWSQKVRRNRGRQWKQIRGVFGISGPGDHIAGRLQGRYDGDLVDRSLLVFVQLSDRNMERRRRTYRCHDASLNSLVDGICRKERLSSKSCGEESGRKEGRRREGSGKRTRDSECRPVAQRLERQPRPGQTEENKNTQEEEMILQSKYGWSTED